MPHKTTVRTNGQTLTVNASVSHWTTEALALTASAANDVESTTTTTITSDYDLWFANTATTATITVKQIDGTVLGTYTDLQVNPGVGTRILSPLPDVHQIASDLVRRREFLPAGAIAQTFGRMQACTNMTVLSTGRLSMVAIDLPASQVITSISFLSGTTAGGTLANQWFALYDSSLNLLGQTTDDTSTAWASNTVKTLSLASPYTTTYSGLHYLGINVTASTVPSLLGVSSSGSVVTVDTKLGAISSTGLTDTAPDPAGALTVSGSLPWAYVS